MITITLCLVLGTWNYSAPIATYNVFSNIQFALARIPTFIFGMFLAPYILKGYTLKFPLHFCVVICSCALLLKWISPQMPMSVFFAIPTTIILCLIFAKENKYINMITSFMGGISLESYLFNVTLPFFIVNHQCVVCGVNIFKDNYLPYFIVIAIGTIMSVIVSKMSRFIFDYMHQKF